MKNGFLIIDKETDMTSNDLVRIVKKKLNVNKVGHSGTLDPDVTGVVVIAIGNATKLLPIITKDSKKKYKAILKFGIKTTTADITGEIILEEEPKVFSKEKLVEVLNDFEKTYDQMPPIYSAKRVNGKRLYEYARNNEEVEIKPSRITIYKNEFTSYQNNELSFNTLVSKGTYIRTLCEDIATKLGTIGTMKYLRRIETDGFKITESIKIDDITEDKIYTTNDYVTDNFPIYEVYGGIADMISHGAVLTIKKDYKYPCAYKNKDSGKLIAIYYNYKEDKIKPLVML